MPITAVIASPGPLASPPQVDVPHALFVIEGGAKPSGKADLFLSGVFSIQRAWRMGLHLAGPVSEPCWLGGTPPALAPLLKQLEEDKELGAIVDGQGLLIRPEALAGLSGPITPRALRAAGWKVTRAERKNLMITWGPRAFTQDDMVAVPDGWTTGPPDFIGVGWGKAGGSWWYDLLSRHPHVVPNRLLAKELHYHCHFGYGGLSDENVETYRAAFARPPGRICGEWSGSYMHHPLAIPNMARAAPDAKLIALVRNPIDRSVSALNQFLHHRTPYMGLSGGPKQVFETFSLFPEAMLASRLARSFRELLRHYPREQLLVLQYERCKADPVGALQETWAFLGLRQTPPPPGIRRKVNTKPYLIEKPGPDQRARMADWFRDDVDEVMEMFPHLDRSLWADFA